MKIKVKLVSGEEKEIEIKDFLSGEERNKIIDKAIEYTQEGRELKGKIKAGELMNEIVRVATNGMDISQLTAESFDEIFSRFAHYFGLGEEKKNLFEDRKSTE